MKKYLILKHIEHEGAGIFQHILNEKRIDCKVVKLWKDGGILHPASDEYSGLIVMGGPMNVDEEDKYPFLKEEKKFIKMFVESGKPYLGICLGAQLLSAAMGGKVYAGGKKEIGFYDVSLTEEGEKDKLFGLFNEKRFKIFQWHGDTFTLPDGARNLISSALYDNQAFIIGDKAYGLQFHMEVTDEMIKEWVDMGRDEIESAGINPDKIIRDIPVYSNELERKAKAFFEAFLKL